MDTASAVSFFTLNSDEIDIKKHPHGITHADAFIIGEL